MALLESVFPQGLDDVDSQTRERLRLAFDEWLDNAAGDVDPALHQAWVRFVLREVLGFDPARDLLSNSPLLRLNLPEHQSELAADFAIINPSTRNNPGNPRVIFSVQPPAQDLDKPIAGELFKAPPVDRMLLLLRGLQAQGTDCRLAVVTNGAAWVLVHVAPGETATYVRWTSEMWLDEPLSLRAFVSLLGIRRCLGVADNETFEALMTRSAKDATEVTDRLGAQVRRATEVLVQTLDRIDRDRKRTLLAEIAPEAVYEAAVTVLMRLVFLLSSEERRLLLLGSPVYDQHYAISTLHDQLQAVADRHGEEVLERRHGAWCRFLATTRAIHSGVDHSDLRLAGHGGSLFDPDRFPFLEGRSPGTSWRDNRQKTVAPLAVDDRTFLHLLRALTRLEIKAGGGRTEVRKLSFRALDVEQIGHVYEGLLDHTARRAEDVTLSLAGKNEPEIPVCELEERNEDTLVKWVADLTGRTAASVKNDVTAYKMQDDDARLLLQACEQKAPLYERIKPWAGLVRKDSHGLPVVIPAQSIYVTEGTDRRSSGTHYTPRILTEPIVQHTLDPLVYSGPAEGYPRDKWILRSASQILSLRVCDLAMGSGAFLVQSCRYLADRLVEAWEAEEKKRNTKLILAPDGNLSTGGSRELAVPLDEDERRILARRFVADRCLFGVDVNPAAVEIGKLSLWLTTMQKGRPFTFLDHALRPGDSLLGVTDARQLQYFHLDHARGKKLHNNLASVPEKTEKLLAQAVQLRIDLEKFSTDDINDARNKAWLLRQANKVAENLRLVGDLLIGAALSTAKKGESALDDLLLMLSIQVAKLLETRVDSERASIQAALRKKADELLNGGREPGQPRRTPFHWAIEFPEVMGDKGFHAIVGNPPFMGGQRLTGTFGTDYRDYLVSQIAEGRRGSADLCAYFFLRGSSLLRKPGTAGLLSTNTIAQGDTREVGLDALVADGTVIHRAIQSRKWPGEANLEVSHVWMHKGTWKGRFVLEDREVAGITSQLSVPGRASGTPYQLAANALKSFQGSIVLGIGFVLTPEQAQDLIKKDARNKNVLFPYLNGEDLNSEPDQQATRWVINFQDWPLDRSTAPSGYSGPVAEDYPDCLDIVRRLVKPERDKNNRAQRRERWWQYAERAPKLYATIAKMDRVLVHPLTSKYHSLVFYPTSGLVFSHMTVVLPFQEWHEYALLQSEHHWIWVLQHGNKLETRPQYTPSDCLETFPFAQCDGREENLLSNVGREYYEHRATLMRETKLGLTKTYNRFHDREDRSAGIVKLRELHVEMDEAVKRAYGWDNLKLGHGFHETKQGVRYTISEGARVEVLDRLLELNHKRYAQEVKQGLHPEAKGKSAGGKKGGGGLTPRVAEGETRAPLLGGEGTWGDGALATGGAGTGARAKGGAGPGKTPRELVLEVLSLGGTVMGVDEIAKATELGASVVKKCVAELVEKGEIVVSKQGRKTVYGKGMFG